MRKLLYVAVAVSMLLMLIVAGTPAMAVTSDTSPATHRAYSSGTGWISGGEDWDDVSWAEQCGGFYAHVHLNHGQYSDYLELDHYGFNIADDPTR
jgi:hypothetical protein